MRFLLIAVLGLGAVIAYMYLGTGDAMSLSNEEKITLARSAAPDFISQNAKVVDENGAILDEGTNSWVCMPGIPPKYENPMCNDPVWQSSWEVPARMRQQPSGGDCGRVRADLSTHVPACFEP